jgi:methylthioribose-1-phosphate isomerase
LRTLWWEDGKVILINQRKLPEKLEHVECLDLQQVAHAIKTLEIRGAPAIGVAAAMALALTAHYSGARSREGLLRELEQGAEKIRQTRPTAWNLFWAADRVISDAHAFKGSLKRSKEAVVAHAQAIAEEDIAINKQLGTHGADLINDRDVVGTICNAVKVAHEQGKNIQVIALETRPVLQGARLTAWELQQDSIPVRVIADSALGYCLSKGMVSKMVVGADRVAVEDGCYVFNKIGTYMAAIAARRHNVPFSPTGSTR